MYEKLEHCPSCKNESFDTFRIVQDYSVSGESFALVKCKKCQLVFTNPRPDVPSLPTYYQSDAYISHTNKGNNAINIVYKLVRRYTTSGKIRLINSYSKHPKLLDYGCGTGFFLSQCVRKGWAIDGVEPDAGARSIAETLIGQSLYSDIQSIDKTARYDVISLWHVLEHVVDLRGTLKLLRKRLQSEGFMFIAVPNHKTWEADYYADHWAGYDVPRHLYHFDQSSMKYLLKKAKLELIDILPMKFDAFYVSLLSEKYKTSSGNFLQALRIGSKSNRHASQTGDYSSLIYIARK